MASSAGCGEAVVVDFSVDTSSGLDAESLRISCSGTFIDPGNGVIVTSGLILSPLFQINQSDQHFCKNFHQNLMDFFGSDSGKRILHRSTVPSSEIVDSCDLNINLLDYIESRCSIKIYVQRPQVNFDRTGDSTYEYKCLCTHPMYGSEPTGQARGVHGKSNIPDKSWIKRTACILTIWRCPALADVLGEILTNNSGWTLTDDSKSESQIEKQTRILLPFFVLLKLNEELIIEDCPFKFPNQLRQAIAPFLSPKRHGSRNNHPVESAPRMLTKLSDTISKISQKCISEVYLWWVNHELQPRMANKPAPSFLDLIRQLEKVSTNMPHLNVGSQLYIMATPFGSLSPNVFLNSVSKGILTNLAGDENVLIMTDARCVPGCEGGAIYLDAQPSKRQLVGLIITPYCWRQNEWVGLTFGVNLRPLLASLFQAVPHSPTGNNSERHSACELVDDTISSLVENVALIKVGSRWGSAVCVKCSSGVKKLLLTCCHVVQQPVGSVIRVRFSSQGKSRNEMCVDAKLIYCTPKGRIYDLAVLEVCSNHATQLPKGIELLPDFIKEGDPVLAVGHGLFDDHMHLSASVTSGVISKILRRDRKQVLIQSTCAVHPGASGGALINERTHQLCGIIVCNAKDALCGASYPHINLSIPSTIIMPVLNDYVKLGDLLVLDRLHDPDPVISYYWQLGYNQIGTLDSKL